MFTTPTARLCCLLGLAALLPACEPKAAAPVATETKPLTAAAQQARIERLKLDFNAPVLIDSSIYVMYPLVLSAGEDGEDEYGSFSKGGGRAETYWNIVFYNTATGESHLLSDAQQMVIHSLGPQESGSGSQTFTAAEFAAYQKAGTSRVQKLLYYAVRITDFNRDGLIDAKDPSYLFVSDRAGQNFRQISPANYHVNDWETLKGTNKILLRATAATIDNQSFSEKDQAVPFIYDLNTAGPVREVFSPAFQTSTKALLNRHWLRPSK